MKSKNLEQGDKLEQEETANPSSHLEVRSKGKAQSEEQQKCHLTVPGAGGGG